MNAAQPNSSTKASILIVDDTPENLQLLTRILTRQDYEVHLAHNGQAALATAQSTHADLILLDILMPDMDGYDVCLHLKADERTRDIPVIFITALDQVMDKVKAFSVGGVDYITKPLRVEEVLARVETHLALKRRTYELDLLNRVGRELAATHDLQRIAEQIQQTVTEIVGAAGTSVWLKERKREEWLACKVAFQHDADHYWTDLRVRLGEGVVGWVAQTGENAIITQASADSRFFSGIDEQTGFQTHSLLAVPLRVRDKVIGVLEVVNKLSGDFDINDLELVETIAASAAIAIDNTWLVDALHQHAADLEHSNTQLHEALNKVKLLSGLLPICSHCKKIRNDRGYWEQVEIYIAQHTQAEFSHGVCPDCMQQYYPELYEKLIERRQNIWQVLQSFGRADLGTIAAEVGLPECNTLNRLQDMVEEGLIKRLEISGQIFYELSN